jgi:hypothetical protein
VTCGEIADLIEPVAAAEREFTPEQAAHVATCARCGPALARARAIERTLAQPAPAAPAALTAAVLRAVRREALRAEETVDRFFNAVLVAGALLVAAGIYIFANLAGFASLIRSASRVVARGDWLITVTASPHATAYLLSTLLVITGAATWWWIERGQRTS